MSLFIAGKSPTVIGYVSGFVPAEIDSCLLWPRSLFLLSISITCVIMDLPVGGYKVIGGATN